MEVRAKGGKGPLLFEWDPETQTVDLIRKDMYYKRKCAQDGPEWYPACLRSGKAATGTGHCCPSACGWP